jgi:hypothetical protein
MWRQGRDRGRVRTIGRCALLRSSPLPIYTAHGAFMKPRVVPHNRPPQARTYGNGRNEMRVSFSTYPTGGRL